MYFLAILMLTASITYTGPKEFKAISQSDDESIPFVEFSPQETEAILNPSAFEAKIILSEQDKKYNQLKDAGLAHRTKKPKKRVSDILFSNDASTVTWKNIPLDSTKKYFNFWDTVFLSRAGTTALIQYTKETHSWHDDFVMKHHIAIIKYTPKKPFIVKHEYISTKWKKAKAISNDARFLAFVKMELLLLIDYKKRKNENIDLLQELKKEVINMFFNDNSTQLTVEYEDKTSEFFTVADSINSNEDVMRTLREARPLSSNNN